MGSRKIRISEQVKCGVADGVRGDLHYQCLSRRLTCG